MEGGQAIKKYGIIYADPPWQYKVYSKKGAGRSAESHYPTMSIEDIRALPVGELADRDCALFLWITFPMLLDALSVIKAWGFTYKTVAFAWVKQNKRPTPCFGAWATGHGPMWSCASWRPRDGHGGNPQAFIKWCWPQWRNTARNPILSGIRSLRLWATCPG